MLELIKRCPDFLEGYRDFCREIYEKNVIWYRPMPPDSVDEGWFFRTKPIYDRRETEMVGGRSRSVHYWAVDGERFIGEFQLRLDFTENVLTDIGSVGYAVRPSEWGKGYGTEILRQGFEIARGFGMEELLLTVNEENAASAHVVEKLGGVLLDTIDAENEAEGKHRLRRYRVRL